MSNLIDTTIYWTPFRTARASRALITMLLKGKPISSDENDLNYMRILALKKHLDTAQTKRLNPVDLDTSDFTPNSPKTFQQVQQGYWASNYLSKREENSLKVRVDEWLSQNKAKTTNLDKSSEEHISLEAKLALEKFKPKNTWFLFYLGKLFAFLTSLGAGFCGAMVAMFITASWGWPALLVTLAGIAIFAAHFILEIVLNRFTTPRYLVNLWKGGFKPSDDDAIRYINLKTYLPLILSLGSAAQVATLTYVSTQSILQSSLILGSLTGALATPIAVTLTVCSLVTIACLLFNSSYSIYRAPVAWWRSQKAKIYPHANEGDQTLRDSQKEYRAIATALTLLICATALIFYCHTIIEIAFASAELVGWVLAIGFNIPALLPFVIDKSFDIAKTVAEHTDWILKSCFPSQNSSLSTASLTGRRAATFIFTIFVAVSLPIWGPIALVKSLLHDKTNSYPTGDAPDNGSKHEGNDLFAVTPAKLIKDENSPDKKDGFDLVSHELPGENLEIASGI